MVPWQKSFMQIPIDIRYHIFQPVKTSYSRQSVSFRINHVCHQVVIFFHVEITQKSEIYLADYVVLIVNCDFRQNVSDRFFGYPGDPFGSIIYFGSIYGSLKHRKLMICFIYFQVPRFCTTIPLEVLLSPTWLKIPRKFLCPIALL